MSVYAPLAGQPKTTLLKLDTTSLTDLYTPPSQIRAVLSSVSFCNIDGASSAFSLAHYNGTDTVYLIKDKTLGVNETYIFNGHYGVLAPGHILRVECDRADAIDISAFIQEVRN